MGVIAKLFATHCGYICEPTAPYASNGSAFARFNPFVILFIYYFATCIMELSSSFSGELFSICLSHQPTWVEVCATFSPSSRTFMESFKFKWIQVVIFHQGITSSTWTTTFRLCMTSFSGFRQWQTAILLREQCVVSSEQKLASNMNRRHHCRLQTKVVLIGRSRN